jgi:hypothetical protein
MPISKVAAIKRFFEANGGRKIDMAELKALSEESRQELGELAAKELGEELAVTN